MNLHTLNPWAVLAAAVSAFVLGGLWYSPLVLGAVWKRANHFEAEPPAAGWRTFVIAFILTLVMAFNLAMFLNDPKTTLAWGATAGFRAGFGWVAMSVGIISAFERRSLSYVLVNAGSHAGPDCYGSDPGRLPLVSPRRIGSYLGCGN